MDHCQKQPLHASNCPMGIQNRTANNRNSIMSYPGMTLRAALFAVTTGFIMLSNAQAANQHRVQQASSLDECTMTSRLEPSREGRDVHIMDLTCPQKPVPSQDDCTFVTSSRIDPDGVQVTVSDLTCPRKNRVAPLNKNGIATLK